MKTFKIGGVHPKDQKLSANKTIDTLALPKQAIIPLSQHIGAPATPVVSKGDYVKVGQLIAKATGFMSANIHSPYSGTIEKIDNSIDAWGIASPSIFIKVEGDAHVEHVGQPDGDDGGHAAADSKGGGDGLEQDVGEAETEAHAEVQTHAALDLTRRERHADKGEDERGKRHGDALVILYLELLDVGEAALLLLVDVLAELGTGKGFVLVLHDEEVAGLHHEHGVEHIALGDGFAHTAQLANHIILYYPVIYLRGVVGDAAGGEVGDELLAVELVEREAVAGLVVVFEAVDVGYDAGIYLELDVSRGVGLARLVVLVFEVQAGDTAVGGDVGAQEEGGYGDDGGRHHVGAQQPLEAHAGGEHGDDFGVLGQLGGEEDDGDEDEQRAEQVGEVGDEVEVVVEHDGLPGGIVLRKAVHLLVEVEHDGDGEDEGDGKDVGTKKLLDDVEV